MTENLKQPVRVWDLPTRFFHWLLALTIVGAIATAWVGGNAMAWHFRLGYCAFTLLAFRLVWGLIGGRWSRFVSFIHPPGRVLRYLRGHELEGEHMDVGHNPIGSFSVFTMLGLLMLQVATGMVADDEIANVGPLNAFVSSSLADRATGWHKGWGQWLLIALIGLHIAAILYYLVLKRTNLVRAMISGDKVVPTGTPASADGLPQRLIAAVVLAVCIGIVAWVVKLGG